ncbi:hypothetical protein FOYG_10178 [Fusarium oxysporum NRRL 32931]|uniref:Uncharacterized protein n=1 Tax=Fusarium oxysporum NRRL 32931 TaxID=660029 RepID=W9I3R9_FUSOX|nr:hypothetical protein FOYG_10178 [Fusarium oxysporum NRRL 32931]
MRETLDGTTESLRRNGIQDLRSWQKTLAQRNNHEVAVEYRDQEKGMATVDYAGAFD